VQKTVVTTTGTRNESEVIEGSKDRQNTTDFCVMQTLLVCITQKSVVF
jgi:hypothetical protein